MIYIIIFRIKDRISGFSEVGGHGVSLWECEFNLKHAGVSPEQADVGPTVRPMCLDWPPTLPSPRGHFTPTHPLALNSSVTSQKHLIWSARLAEFPLNSFTVVCHHPLILWPFQMSVSSLFSEFLKAGIRSLCLLLLLMERISDMYILLTIYLNPIKPLWGRYHYAHFTDEEIKAQRDSGLYPKKQPSVSCRGRLWHW